MNRMNRVNRPQRQGREGTPSSDLAQQLRLAAEARLPEALDWLQRLVAVNSFTANAAGVNRVAELTAALFAPLGFTAEFVPSRQPGCGQHLFLRRQPPGAAQDPVLLVTHSDTVFPPEEEQQHDFHWREEPATGRIYGPGTVDNKGGTVAIWLLLHALREAQPERFEQTHWLVAANAAEEVIGADFGERAGERCAGRARAVLVFEGGPRVNGQWHVVTSRKGRAEYRITATGRAAHAGSAHQEGINAVVALAAVLPKAAALTDYAAELTVNVASVQGGTVLNRVPHAAQAELEVRAYEPALLTRVDAALQGLAGRTDAGAQLEVTCLGRTAAWPAAANSRTLFAAWAAAGEALDMPVIAVPRGGLSDANYLCSLGPTLDALGPVGGRAHCSERSADGSVVPEYLEPQSLVPKTVLNALALTHWLRGE